jgi:hypothetical protein
MRTARTSFQPIGIPSTLTPPGQVDRRCARAGRRRSTWRRSRLLGRETVNGRDAIQLVSDDGKVTLLERLNPRLR